MELVVGHLVVGHGGIVGDDSHVGSGHVDLALNVVRAVLAAQADFHVGHHVVHREGFFTFGGVLGVDYKGHVEHEDAFAVVEVNVVAGAVFGEDGYGECYGASVDFAGGVSAEGNAIVIVFVDGDGKVAGEVYLKE